MSIVSLNTNTLTKVSNRALNHSSNRITKSVEKLSTGKRVNGAGDDIASLSIAAKIDTNLRGISKAKQNIIDQKGHLEVIHNGFNTFYDGVQRIRELFVQGLNGTNSVQEKDALQREVDAIKEQLDSVKANTKVVTGTPQEYILNGTNYTTFVQSGVNDSGGFTIDYNSTFGAPDEPEAVGLGPSASITSNYINFGLADGLNRLANIKIPGATIESSLQTEDLADNDSLSDLDTMLSNMHRMAGVYQADMARLDEAFTYLEGQAIALSKSKSHFEDTDIGEESTHLAREQIRQQSAAAMSTQANAQGQFVLSLLP